MERNIKQHNSFAPGFEAFVAYVGECVERDDSWKKYSVEKFQVLINAFGGELASHLEQEIGTLLELEKYDVKVLKREYKKWDASQQQNDKVCDFFIPLFQ